MRTLNGLILVRRQQHQQSLSGRDECSDAVGAISIIVRDKYEWFLRIHKFHFVFSAKVRKKVYKAFQSHIKYVSL